MPEKLKLFVVDAFTSFPFSGNPAAVCLLEDNISGEIMQKIAAEINLSETAFVLVREGHFYLRWFTPTVEIDLCGHATLAAYHVLREMDILKKDEKAVFETKSGVLEVAGSEKVIEIKMPVDRVETVLCPPEISNALGVRSIYCGKNSRDYLVELSSEEMVRGIEPKLHFIEQLDCRGVIVTASSDSREYDFISRFFAPAIGITEDPVTGSACCALGPFWRDKLGKSNLVCYQASLRGGVMRIVVESGWVIVGGEAITVFKGDLFF